MNSITPEPGLSDPQDAFGDPQRIVSLRGVSREDKIAMLLNWKQDLIELQSASGENMPSPCSEPKVAVALQAVSDALVALGYTSPASHG
jgi:Holliday junction resolvasome RuvABC DNA-binding subunit